MTNSIVRSTSNKRIVVLWRKKKFVFYVSDGIPWISASFFLSHSSKRFFFSICFSFWVSYIWKLTTFWYIIYLCDSPLRHPSLPWIGSNFLKVLISWNDNWMTYVFYAPPSPAKYTHKHLPLYSPLWPSHRRLRKRSILLG